MNKQLNPLTIKSNMLVAIRMIRADLVRDAKYKCVLCGKSVRGGFELHHKDGCGLNWARENLMVLCEGCHHFITGQNNRNQELALDWSKPPPLSKEYIREVYDTCHPRA